jgi:superfamily I DNA and/or RNA helicase
MAVGVEVDKMNSLQQMFIQGKIPNSHLYDAKTSIYDIAKTTFQPLMLREHFRCVPEIIGFSNMLSYDYKIKPLRDASNSTLLPAVVNYRVADGKRLNNKTNPNEAQAIVALMKACIEQPEYDGKTFGVISLLGDEQVRCVQRLIEETIDHTDIVERDILCGNASNFQGDERDVIFLSVVDSVTTDHPAPIHLQNFAR